MGNLDPALFQLEILVNPLDAYLCPVRHMEHYIHVTAHLCTSRFLFVSTLAPFDQLSSQRLSKWIRVSIAWGLNRESDFKPQSTRSVVASNLFSKGIPLDDIMAQCHWKHSCAFYQHYHKQNPNLPVHQFWKECKEVKEAMKTKLSQARFHKLVSVLNEFSQSKESASSPRAVSAEQSSSASIQSSQFLSEEFILDSALDSDSDQSFHEPYMSPL